MYLELAEAGEPEVGEWLGEGVSRIRSTGDNAIIWDEEHWRLLNRLRNFAREFEVDTFVSNLQ